MEYLLQLWATPHNISCNDVLKSTPVPPHTWPVVEEVSTLNFNADENLIIGGACSSRHGECPAAGCYVDVKRCHWRSSQWDDWWGAHPDNAWLAPLVTPGNVLAEFHGSNGRIMVLDTVPVPQAHPWALFPSSVRAPRRARGTAWCEAVGQLTPPPPPPSPQDLWELVTCNPYFSKFAQLALLTGVAELLEVSNTTSASNFSSLTVFAPSNAAWARLHPSVQAYLFSPAGRGLATYILLSHVLDWHAGGTYVYTCSLAGLAASWSNVTQHMSSGTNVTFSGDLVRPTPSFCAGGRLAVCPPPPLSPPPPPHRRWDGGRGRARPWWRTR